MAVGSAHHNRSSTLSQINKLSALNQPKGDISESHRSQHRRVESTSYTANLFKNQSDVKDLQDTKPSVIPEMTGLHDLRDSLDSLFASTPHFDG